MSISLAVAAGCAHRPARQATAPGLAVDSPLQAAETRRQSRERAREQDHAFVVGLSAAVRDERRDEAWAGHKEQQLRETFASSLAGQIGMTFQRLTCKTTLCELVLEAGPSMSAPAGPVPPFAAVDQWLAWQQPCGYTLSMDPVAPTALFAFLHCTK